MQDIDIAVVGAGIAGLTASLALAKQGNRVHLYEAAPAWGDVGAGITLAPNAMRGMDYVGVGKAIEETGIEPTTQLISHWQDDQTLLTVDRRGTKEKYGAAYVYIHRADLHNILVDAATNAGVQISLNKRADAVETSAEGASIRFADGTVANADLVVAADGLKSQIRTQFDTKPPHFTGHIAFRALAPVTPAIQHLVDQPGMHIGPGKMVVRYPLRKGNILNLVFFARQDGWTEDGWSIPAAKSELNALYGDWCPNIQTLLESVAEGSVFKWAINAHQPIENWIMDNRVTLLGDAAHAMTPFMGQGAATGIEDAVVLARILEDSATLAEALPRYQAARLERTSFIQQESNANADRLQGDQAELYGLGNLRNEETLGLFAYDCVSEPV